MTLPLDLPRVHHATPPTRKRSSAAPRLLAELMRRASDTADRSVAVTRAELAAALGVSERTIKRASSDLVESGFIDKISPDSWYEPNTYRLLL